jgi:hypothetical protein
VVPIVIVFVLSVIVARRTFSMRNAMRQRKRAAAEKANPPDLLHAQRHAPAQARGRGEGQPDVGAHPMPGRTAPSAGRPDT